MIPKTLTFLKRSATMSLPIESITKYKENKEDISTYLDRLKYALDNESARIQFQEDRLVDVGRKKEHTNRYTITKLFPNEDPVEVIKTEFRSISVQEYIETVKDLRYSKRSDMRVFGRKYGSDEVYIKFRVEILPDTHLFVMSFHFSAIQFGHIEFPYI
jgi:hypothetical protein